MIFQGLPYNDLQGGMLGARRINQLGQVAPQVQADGQEVRDDDEFVDARACSRFHRGGEVGRAPIEKRGADVFMLRRGLNCRR